MSVSFDDGSQGGRWPALRSWIAHSQITMMLAWFGFILVMFWATASWPVWAQTVTVIVALFGYLGLQVTASIQHERRFCDRCLTEAPIDGKAEAEKKSNKDKLILVHKISNLWFIVLRLAGVMVLAYLVPTWVFIPVLIVLDVPVLHMANVHRRLRAWCPLCHPGDNGGGDDDFTPVPDPVMTQEKVS